jgi:hypothetical protein
MSTSSVASRDQSLPSVRISPRKVHVVVPQRVRRHRRQAFYLATTSLREASRCDLRLRLLRRGLRILAPVRAVLRIFIDRPLSARAIRPPIQSHRRGRSAAGRPRVSEVARWERAELVTAASRGFACHAEHPGGASRERPQRRRLLATTL